MEGYFLFTKSKTNGQKKIISLIAKTKTNRPGKPGLKYYILYPRESEVRRSVCSGADAGGSEFQVTL